MKKNAHQTQAPVVTELPARLSREIGRVIVEYAHLEWRLSLILYDLLDLDRIAGRLAVREPRAPECIDLIKDLMAHRGIKTPNINFIILREKIQSVTSQRDQIAHGLWVKPEGGSKVFLRLLKGTWQPQQKGKVSRRIQPEAPEYDAADAASLVALIKVLNKNLFELRDEINGALAPLRDKPTGPH